MRISNIIGVLSIATLFSINHIHAQELSSWGEYEDVKKSAIERIERYRKGDVELVVKTPDNKPLKKGDINIELVRHEFKWGAVVDDCFETSPYSAIYKQNMLKYFNASGFAMALKPKQRGSKSAELTERVLMPWFQENDFYMRGHNLAWEGYRFLPDEQKAIVDDKSLTPAQKGERLMAMAKRHIEESIPKWDVECWDVSNEPIANDVINQYFPDFDTHVVWFKYADSLLRVCGKRDRVKLYQNDYQIISTILKGAKNFTKEGYSTLGRIELYQEILDRQIAAGAPIDGIGFQSRLRGGLITPDTVYSRLCQFDRFNRPYQATEFEIRDSDLFKYSDEQRRMLMEQMMIIYFSHPKVEGFWNWTFCEPNAKGEYDYPLFNYDGTPKVSGQAWIDLMEGFLSCRLQTKTNRRGELSFRGYWGTYSVKAKVGGKTYVGEFTLSSDMDKDKLEIILR